MLTQDKDEELVLFLEMRHRQKDHLELGSDNNHISAATMSSRKSPYRRTAADNFLYSEKEKSDYDWLVTPPGSPSKSQLDAPDVNQMALQSRLKNYFEEESNNISSRKQRIGLKRPSSSNSSRSTSRPLTPTKRSTTPTSRITSSSRSSTPTKRPSTSGATLTPHSTSTSRSTSRASTPTKRPSSSGTSRVTSSTCSTRSMSRPCTPTNRPPSSGTSRANLTTSRVTSSTTSSRPPSRPSTPTSRPSSSGTSRANLTTARATTSTRPMTAPSTKPGSRSNTPTRRPSTPTGSSNVLKSKPTKPVRIPAPSPVSRSRPWEPYEMPGFSLEPPSNLRTTLPDRPRTSSSRGTRPGSSASSSRSTSIEPIVGRKQSCSPSRNRAGPSLRGRGVKTSKEDGGLGHVAMGNQKVERVVNTRKLAPPRVTEHRGREGSGRSGSGGFGFGRNLSQSSIDMALRHLGVKRGSMTGNLRPLVNKAPAASVYSVRSSGTTSKRPVSSSGSSESSVNILCLDGSDDNLSDISYS